MLDKINEYRKFLISVLTSVATVLTFVGGIPFIPANVHTAVGIIVAAIGSLLVAITPNKPATASTSRH
jgi:hypothetical protein